MKDIKKILDTFRDSNNIEINTKTDKPANIESLFDFNALQLESTALKYYELVTLEEISELEAKQLEKILEQAETNERLNFLLNEIDELTFKELGFYEKDSLEQIKNLKVKVKEFIINSDKNQKTDCIDKLQSISGYQNILNEYYKLTTLEELNELEAKQLEKILEQAEIDERLSLLLNEIDELTFQELSFYEKVNLEQIEQQKEETKNHIKGIFYLTSSNNPSLSKVNKIYKHKGYIKSSLAIAVSCLIGMAGGSLLLCNLLPNISQVSGLINHSLLHSLSNIIKVKNYDLAKQKDDENLILVNPTQINEETKFVANIESKVHLMTTSAPDISYLSKEVLINIQNNSKYISRFAGYFIIRMNQPTGDVKLVDIKNSSVGDLRMPIKKSGHSIIDLSLTLASKTLRIHQLQNSKVIDDSTAISASVPSRILHDVKFICKSWQGVPTTIVQTSQKEFPLIHWKSDYFSMSGYSAEIRCKQVSQRFNELYRMGNLNYLTTARINGYPVICATKEIGGDCFEQLFTVNPDIDLDKLLDDISKKLIRVSKKNHKDRPKFTEEIASNNIVGVIGHFSSNATNSVVKYLDMNQYLSRVIALEQNTDIAISL